MTNYRWQDQNLLSFIIWLVFIFPVEIVLGLVAGALSLLSGGCGAIVALTFFVIIGAPCIILFLI